MERIITPAELEEDSKGELSLRPQKISEYIGQDKVKERARYIYKGGSKKRGSFRPCSFIWTSRTR